MNFSDFIKFTEQHCLDNNIKFTKSKDISIPFAGTDSLCTGYFDDGKLNDTMPELAVAMGSPAAFGVLVHELNHSIQFLENSKEWIDISPTESEVVEYGNLSQDLFFNWIDGKVRPSSCDLMRQFKATVRVELDCEIRTVQMIKDKGIDIDVVEYTQKANSYVYMYQYFLKHRTFYKSGKEPYNIEAVWSNMPKDFETLEYLKPLDETYERLYRNHCF